MSYHERMAFDEKLSEDASLKEAFSFYKDHRMAMLQDLIEEHRLTRRDTRFNKLIFLLISLTGIALTVNYYYLHKENTNAPPAPVEQKHRKPFYTYIPFVNWEKRAEKTEIKKDSLKKAPVVAPVAEAKETAMVILEPSAMDEERSENDVFLTDSFVLIHDKAYIQMLLSAKKANMDTALADSVITIPKAKNKDKNNQLFVEFWQSPVQYRGYRFNGKKLILYGIEHPYEIYVYKDDNVIYLLHPFGQTPLIQQPNFHLF